ncbi:MAG: hypothetical protein WD096_01790 [Actinomycetota bacterium]
MRMCATNGRSILRLRLPPMLLAGLTLLMGGCADRDTQPAGGAETNVVDGQLPDPPAVPKFDPAIWVDPLGATASELTASGLDSLAFDPILPGQNILAGEIGSFTDDREEMGALAAVAWAFENSEFGRFILVETPSGATQERLEAPAVTPAGCTTEQGSAGADYDTVIRCHGEGFSLVGLERTVAAAVEGPQAVSITWIVPAKGPSSELRDLVAPNEPVIEMMLMGPTKETTIDELVEIARRLGF